MRRAQFFAAVPFVVFAIWALGCAQDQSGNRRGSIRTNQNGVKKASTLGLTLATKNGTQDSFDGTCEPAIVPEKVRPSLSPKAPPKKVAPLAGQPVSAKIEATDANKLKLLLDETLQGNKIAITQLAAGRYELSKILQTFKHTTNGQEDVNVVQSIAIGVDEKGNTTATATAYGDQSLKIDYHLDTLAVAIPLTIERATESAPITVVSRKLLSSRFGKSSVEASVSDDVGSRQTFVERAQDPSVTADKEVYIIKTACPSQSLSLRAAPSQLVVTEEIDKLGTDNRFRGLVLIYTLKPISPATPAAPVAPDPAPAAPASTPTADPSAAPASAPTPSADQSGAAPTDDDEVVTSSVVPSNP